MPQIIWNDALSVGVPQIDLQHKELLCIANGLLHAISINRSKRTIDNVITRLREYTVFHFNSEEKLM